MQRRPALRIECSRLRFTRKRLAVIGNAIAASEIHIRRIIQLTEQAALAHIDFPVSFFIDAAIVGIFDQTQHMLAVLQRRHRREHGIVSLI